MSGMVSNVHAVSGFPFIGANFHYPALLTANTPTGGDMGAHVLLPQYLRDNLLPSGRILGWSNDWYAGYPALYFYFPLPALVTVLLDVFLPYGVAFKLVAVAGLLALPAATYFLVRSMQFSRTVAAVSAVTGSAFLFMESFSIFGANIKSTLAGEFSFSWSFALSLVYLGLVIRAVREGRRFTLLAGVVLALTALSHIVTTAVVVAVSLPLLLRRNGQRVLTGSWILGFSLAAFWALPLAIRHFQGYTTDMGWSPVRAVVGDSIPGSPFPGELIPFLGLAVVGVFWTMVRRDDVIVLAWLTGLPLAGYFLLPLTGVTIVYNARLLPYWYFGLHVFAGLAIGLGVMELARWLPQHRKSLVIALALVTLMLVNTTIAGIHDVPGWVRWNFTGYEGKATFQEYEALIDEVGELPPGRIMWEHNNDVNKYGTPMALMLIPYFSDDHASMEGVFFESALTTPFHFLNQSEVSRNPSNPVRGLRYRGLDFERGVKHLGVYNVDYYISYTEEAADAARTAGLPVLSEAAPWTVFELPASSLVDVAPRTPGVWAGDGDFVDASLDWYDDIERLDDWLVMEGPDDWPRTTHPVGPFAGAASYDSSGVVIEDVVLDDHKVSFTTNGIGIPHLVKVSYFPNWTATGAEGPYRAAPSLMVVVPTDNEVVLEFKNTPAENVGNAMTAGGLLFLAGLGWWRRRARSADALVEETAA